MQRYIYTNWSEQDYNKKSEPSKEEKSWPLIIFSSANTLTTVATLCWRSGAGLYLCSIAKRLARSSRRRILPGGTVCRHAVLASRPSLEWWMERQTEVWLNAFWMNPGCFGYWWNGDILALLDHMLDSKDNFKCAGFAFHCQPIKSCWVGKALTRSSQVGSNVSVTYWLWLYVHYSLLIQRS